MAAATGPLIAVVDATEAVVALVCELLHDEGFTTVSFYPAADAGPLAVAGFLSAHRPRCCVFNLTVPYAESVALLLAIQGHLPALPFVLTTTDPGAVRPLLPDDADTALVGEPFALDELITAVRRAAGDQPEAPLSR
jgi:DNA-binding NtrC family response regulator